MTAILRAPLLSATSTIDRIWIMAASPRPSGRRGPLDCYCLAHDAFERPAFPPTHRPRFDNRDHVAGLRFILLVVDHELRGAALGLAVEPMPYLPLDGDDTALLHPVADDHTHFFRFDCHHESSGGMGGIGGMGGMGKPVP